MNLRNRLMRVWMALAVVVLASSAPAAGQALGPVTPVSFTPPATAQTPNATSPVVAHDTRTGHYLVVWGQAGADNRVELFDRVLDAAGTPASAPRQVTFPNAPRTVGVSATGAVLTYNRRSGEYLLAWLDLRGPGVNSPIFVQRLSADGTPIGGPLPIPQDAWAGLGFPAVAADTATGTYLVTWAGGRDTDSRNVRVWGERLRPDGRPLGGAVRISRAGESAFPGGIDVAFDARRRSFVVVWGVRATAAGGGEVTTVSLRRMRSRNGAMGRGVRIFNRPWTHEPGINAARVEPVIAVNQTADQYLVALPHDGELWSRRVRGHGPSPKGHTQRLWTRTPNEQLGAADPAIAFDRRHREYLVAWNGNCDASTPGLAAGCPDSNVLGQVVNAAGRPVGAAAFAVSPSQPPGESLAPTIAFNSARAGFLVAWQGPANERSNCRPLMYGQACDQAYEVFGRTVRAKR